MRRNTRDRAVLWDRSLPSAGILPETEILEWPEDVLRDYLKSLPEVFYSADEILYEGQTLYVNRRLELTNELSPLFEYSKLYGSGEPGLEFDVHAGDNAWLIKDTQGFRILPPSDRPQFHVEVEAFDLRYINRVGWLDFEVCLTVVPVEISAFTCTQKEKTVVIKWKTESEQANLGFNIYRRKQDESKSVRINDTIINGAGTSASVHSYEYLDESVEMNTTYTYKLEDVSLSGKKHFYPVEIKISVTSAIKDFSLDQNYPNPFNPETIIKYQLPKSCDVVIKIYNTPGQEIKTLINEKRNAGYHKIIWDGKDNSGQIVSTGIYLYQIKAEKYIAIKKMIFLQ